MRCLLGFPRSFSDEVCKLGINYMYIKAFLSTFLLYTVGLGALVVVELSRTEIVVANFVCPQPRTWHHPSTGWAPIPVPVITKRHHCGTCQAPTEPLLQCIIDSWDTVAAPNGTSADPPRHTFGPSAAPHTEIELLGPDRCQLGHRCFVL